MDYGWYNGKQGLSGRDKQPHEKEQVSLLNSEFHFPVEYAGLLISLS